MSKLVGAGDQHRQDFLFDASGTILTGGTPQLLIPQHSSRSYFLFVNNSDDTLYLDFGCGAGPIYAYATISNGAVSAVTVVNPGFNFTQPPLVRFVGGGQPIATAASGQPQGINTSYVGAGGPGFPSPSNFATGIATLTGSAISGEEINSIVITNPGSGYVTAPWVILLPSDLDPNGVVIPGVGYPGSVAILPDGEWVFESTTCPTDAVSVVGVTQGDPFTCKFMT